MGERVALAQVWVPPHVRVRDGNVQNVDGYWREGRPGERVRVNTGNGLTITGVIDEHGALVADAGQGFRGLKFTGGQGQVDVTPEGVLRTHSPTQAARALSEGLRVELERVEQAPVLLDRMRELAAEAVERGEQAPVYDLCGVLMSGTSLFCAKSRGVPRVEMPQLGGDPVPGTPSADLPVNPRGRVDLMPGFLERLREQGVGVREGLTFAAEVLPTQNELNGAKVAGIYQAIKDGRQLPSMYVSRDGYLLDGHHRWAALVALDTLDGTLSDIPMQVLQVDLSITELLAYAREYSRMMGLGPQGVEEFASMSTSFDEAVGTLSNLLALAAQIWVPPHTRVRDGNVQNVDGYFRRGVPGEKVNVDLGGGALTLGTVLDDGRVDVNGVAMGDVRAVATQDGGAELDVKQPFEGMDPGLASGGEPPSGPSLEMSEEDYEAYRADVEKVLSVAWGQEATDRTEKVDGAWKPERAATQREIVDELYAEWAEGVPTDGQVAFTGGMGGSGKGTFLRSGEALFDREGYVVVDPDAVKAAMIERGMLPDVEGLAPAERAALIHEESSEMAWAIAEKAMAERRNLLWDITFSGEGSVARRLDAAETAGYEPPQGFFIDIPVELSVERALARHRRGTERRLADPSHPGGRYVPPEVIRGSADPEGEYNSKNRRAFEALKGRFGRWQLVDNSGDAPEIIEEGGGLPDADKPTPGGQGPDEVERVGVETVPEGRSGLRTYDASEAAAEMLAKNRVLSTPVFRRRNIEVDEDTDESDVRQLLAAVSQRFPAGSPIIQLVDEYKNASGGEKGLLLGRIVAMLNGAGDEDPFMELSRKELTMSNTSPPDDLVALARIYVPPHARVRHGRAEQVDGYWREGRPGERVLLNIAGATVPGTVTSRGTVDVNGVEIRDVSGRLDEGGADHLDFGDDAKPVDIGDALQSRLSPMQAASIADQMSRTYDVPVRIESSGGGTAAFYVGGQTYHSVDDLEEALDAMVQVDDKAKTGYYDLHMSADDDALMVGLAKAEEALRAMVG